MGGSPKQEVTKYGMSLHFGVCAKADVLLAITIKEKEAWSGRVNEQKSFIINKPELFGGISKEGGIDGVVYWLPGESTQVMPDLLARKFGRANGADCPGFRGIASIFMTGPAGTPYSGFNWSKKVKGKKGMYWSGNIPYLPGVWITVRRAPVGLNPAIALVPRLGVDFFPYAEAGAGGMSMSNLRFSADGRTFVICEGLEFQVWDAISHEMIASYPTTASGGVFGLAGGGFYAICGSGPDTGGIIFVSIGGGDSLVVSNTDAGALSFLFYLNDAPYAVGFGGGAGYAVVPSAPPVYIGVIDWFFIGPDGEVWGVGNSGSDIVVTKGDGTSFTVASPTTGFCYGMANPEGLVLVCQNDTFILIDPVLETIADTAAVPATSEQLVFSNVRPQAESIWFNYSEYDTVTLSLIRTVNPASWSAGGTVLASVYSPTDHALLTKPLFDDTIEFRMLDRGGYDANPAHIIFESLTNTDWGMGSPTTLIDVDSFEAAAVTLAAESLGLSLIWTRQATIQDFIQEILDHIQAVIFVDPSTGLLTLKLVRADYNPDTLEVINPSNAILSSFSRKIWGDIANEINVSWTNPDTEQEETVTVQDLASIAAQAGVVSDSRNYYGVRTAALAQRLAQRELRSAGAPLAGCEAQVSREFWEARPASVYKVTWPEHGLSEVVMRVIEVGYGKPGDASLRLTLLEDVYGLDIGEYLEPASSLWEDPSSPPAPLEKARALTLPRYMEVNSPVDVSGSVYPQVLAGVLGTTTDADTFSYELWSQSVDTLGNLVWTFAAELNVVGYGELVTDLAAEASSTGIDIDAISGNVFPEAGVFVFIGDVGEAVSEIALITSAGLTYAFSRGVLDTVPRSWTAGTPVFFVGADTLFEDAILRSAGEEVRFLLRTRTSLGLLDLSAATSVTYELTERPWLPTRPANVEIDGVQFNTVTTPIDMIGESVVPVTWSNRNRLLEDGQVLAWTDGDVAAEDGQTTRISIHLLDGTEIAVHDLLAGTSFDIPIASFAGNSITRVRVAAERTDDDGTFVSLQAQELFVQVAAVTFDQDSITFDADTITWDAA